VQRRHRRRARTSALAHPAQHLGRFDRMDRDTPPLGYDPAPIFGFVDAPDFSLLRLTPYAIELGDVSGQGERRIVWRATTEE